MTKTSFVLLDLAVDEASLVIEHADESLNKNQVRGWGNVVVAAHLLLVADGELSNTGLHVHTNGDETLLVGQV